MNFYKLLCFYQAKKYSILYFHSMLKTTIQIQLLALILLCSTVVSQYNQEDWNERDSWMPLNSLFQMADLKAGNTVADIGCHEGYLTMHLSKRVGDTGKVYAVDVRENRLEVLNTILKENEISNVKTIKGDYDNPKLPNGELDIVFIIDTYHEIDDYYQVLEHIRKALKPYGKLVLLEKLKAAHKNKSRKEQAAAHTLSYSYVAQELQEAGFTIEAKILDLGIWNNEPEKRMWLLVATPEN